MRSLFSHATNTKNLQRQVGAADLLMVLYYIMRVGGVTRL